MQNFLVESISACLGDEHWKGAPVANEELGAPLSCWLFICSLFICMISHKTSGGRQVAMASWANLGHVLAELGWWSFLRICQNTSGCYFLPFYVIWYVYYFVYYHFDLLLLFMLISNILAIVFLIKGIVVFLIFFLKLYYKRVYFASNIFHKPPLTLIAYVHVLIFLYLSLASVLPLSRFPLKNSRF